MLRGALVPILAIFVIGVLPAHAIQCGDTITTDTTLDADLGPCSFYGLVLAARGGSLTLNLNGHTITGSGTGYGLLGPSGNITVKGPGTITKFGVGIAVDGSAMLIYNVVLTDNDTGVWTTRYGGGRLLNNLIIGKNQQSTGVAIMAGSNMYIYQNKIRGHSEGVHIGGEVYKAVVAENTITHNQTGIFAVGAEYSCFFIRGNHVSHNDGNGIQTTQLPSLVAPEIAVMTESCTPSGVGAAVEDNTVEFNGGDGIVVRAAYHGDQVVQDNMVSSNQGNGITILGNANSQGKIQIIGNYSKHNGTDHFWDEIGTNYCWQQNVFDTSSPQTLPPCQ